MRAHPAWRSLSLLLLLALVASVAIPVAWAAWGGTPEARSRVLATPDGTAVSALNPLPTTASLAAQQGAGATTATTLRTVTATDSPDVTSLATLAGTVAASKAAVTPALSSAAAQAQLPLVDADTGAGTVDRLPVTLQVPAGGGPVAVSASAGNNDAGTLRVTLSGRAGATEACTSAAVGDAGNAHVIAARAGRKLSWIQIGNDPDGQLRVTRASTTGVGCAVGALLNPGTASTAGGYWEDTEAYSGDIAVCATAGTVSYCYGETY